MQGASVRADRLLSILLMLQTNRRMTTEELAGRLEVSSRTIHRDMDALSGAGVPVAGFPGRGGGWELLEPYRTDLTGLTRRESQTMFLDALPHPLSDLGLDQAARSARLKLLAALTQDARNTVEHTRQRLYIDPTGWRGQTRDTPGLLSTIQAAVWSNQRIRITYRRADGTVVERAVSPLGLVAKGQVWYLVAATNDDFRTYRISRMIDVEIDDAPADRPRISTCETTGNSRPASSRRRYPASRSRWTSRSRCSIVSGLDSFARVEEIGEPGADGWTPVRIDFGVGDEACGFVLRYGTEIRNVDPPGVMHDALARAQTMIERFGAPDGGSKAS
ncbi:MAG: YafY family protein [Thermomicrobiales bacterium]